MYYPYELVNGRWQLQEPNNGVRGAVNAELWLDKDWKETAPIIEYNKKEDIIGILGIISRSLYWISKYIKG